ncbi:MAG: hypothetical protein J0H09_26260 [Burkholderiales bacterium]|nr:hypothetical protein [Burkholderiales bacterium]
MVTGLAIGLFAGLGTGACLSLAPLAATAQTVTTDAPAFEASATSTTSTTTDTTAATAAPAALATPVYRSVFSQYRRFDEQPMSPWAEANETVGRIGGWRAYAREAQQAEEGQRHQAPGHDHAGGSR